MARLEDNLQVQPAVYRLAALLPDGLDGLDERVRRALEHDDYSRALKLANQRWAKRGAADRTAGLTYAALLLGRGLAGEARGVVRKALEAHPDDPALRAARADSFLVDGELDQARQALEAIVPDALGDDRSLGRVLGYVGDLWADLGEDDQAIRLWQAGVDRGLRDVDVLLQLARTYQRDAALEAAARAYELAARARPQQVGLWQTAAEAWMEADDPRRAHELYGRVLALDDEASADEWLEHGVALVELGELAAAADALEHALDLDPFMVDALVRLGYVQIELGQPEDAISTFRRVLSFRKRSVAALSGIVAAALVVGDLSLAETHARRAVDAGPTDPQARHHLAVVLQQLRRFDEALEHTDAALEHAPDDPRLLATRALLLHALDQPVAARQAIDRAATIDPDDAAGPLEFLEALLVSGEFDAAARFAAAVDTRDPVWPLVVPVVDFLLAAYDKSDEPPEAAVARLVDRLAAADRDLVPVWWDFDRLGRLAHALERDQRRTFDAMVAVLEGRKPPAALDRLGGQIGT